jgi:hypothetical protein
MSGMSIGADPEMFVTDGATVIPVCGRIGGTKDQPLRMRPEWNEGYAVQEDNVMLEFNIPACYSAPSFQSAITHGVEGSRRILRSNGMDAVIGVAEHLFPSKILEQHPKSKEFGCSPDFNAYSNGAPNSRVSPNELEESGGAWRFAGGHVHVGYSAKIPPFAMACLMDLAVGLPSIGEDPQERRRKFYGTAGRYRPTSYGIEYRTLSNYWIWSGTTAARISYRVFALQPHIDGSLGILQSFYTKIPWLDVKTTIDSNDSLMARQLISYVRDELKFDVFPG